MIGNGELKLDLPKARERLMQTRICVDFTDNAGVVLGRALCAVSRNSAAVPIGRYGATWS